MVLALMIFITTYALLLVFPKYRAYIALVSAGIFTFLYLNEGNILTAFGVALGAIEWNVIMMIAGTMGVVALFIESKMPSLLADMIIEKTPNVKWAMVALAIFSGVISAFVDNVATVLMVAPIAVTIAKKLKISPVPSVIAIAIFSNLEGAATLVGDTTSILFAGHVGLDFTDFFVMDYEYLSVPVVKVGMFWIVQAGLLAATFILLYLFRNEKEPIITGERTVVKDYVPTVLLVGTVLLLIIASFFDNLPKLKNGYICMGMLVIGLIYYIIKHKGFNVVKTTIKEIDVFTLLLLAGLFIIIAGITEAGVITTISDFIASISQGNIFLAYTIIVWFSVIISGFIDNIPYVATMLPVAAALGVSLNVDPMILYAGLLIGSTLGGNLTPIGASANVAGIGILRKEGYEVSVGQYMRIGIPVTLVAVLTGYLLILLLY